MSKPSKFIIDFIEKNMEAPVILTPMPIAENDYLYDPEDDSIRGFLFVTRYPYMTYYYNIKFEEGDWQIRLKHTDKGETINLVANMIYGL